MSTAQEVADLKVLVDNPHDPQRGAILARWRERYGPIDPPVAYDPVRVPSARRLLEHRWDDSAFMRAVHDPSHPLHNVNLAH